MPPLWNQWIRTQGLSGDLRDLDWMCGVAGSECLSHTRPCTIDEKCLVIFMGKTEEERVSDGTEERESLGGRSTHRHDTDTSAIEVNSVTNSI